MKTMTIKEIAMAVGIPCRAEGEISEICTDTRAVTSGCLFVAIRGERFDGNDFADEAIRQGAGAVLCERKGNLEHGIYLVVKDTRIALLRLAEYYAGLFPIPKVGLTGSVGKTTTKEMTAAVLSRCFRTLKTEGNFNNQIGLPKMVFRLDDSIQAAVFEMGMDHAGQISSLSRTVKPDVGIITKIGVSHIENLGSQEGILHAKMEITDGMREGTPLVLNGDDPLLLKAAESCGHPVILFGIDNPSCRVTASHIRQEGEKTFFLLSVFEHQISVELPAVGRHQVYDALAAAAAGSFLGVPLDEIARGLSEYVPSGMRQRVVRHKGLIVIEDCYNASPDSIKAALQALASMEGVERKIAVLGDMLELGEYAEKAHRNCGRLAAQSGVDLLFAYGENARFYVEEAEKCGVQGAFYEDKDGLANALLSQLKPGDCVLFKASRGMKLEEVIQKIYQEF